MLERKPDILDAAAIKPGVSMQRKGTCHNCGDQSDGLFCDADCRDDYEWRVKREQANGKRA